MNSLRLSTANVLILFQGARVIVDLSWPYATFVDLFGDIPVSVNAGIDMSQYPTAMTSIEKVLERINEVGPSAYLVKQDWSDAYKHIHVSPG